MIKMHMQQFLAGAERENRLSLAKKTGNKKRERFLWLVLVQAAFQSIGASAPEISLTAVSRQGIPIDSIAVGTPFTLVVTIKDGGSAQNAPEIGGLNSVSLIGRNIQSEHTEINGVKQTRIRFLYTVVADRIGTLTLGPVTSKDVPRGSSSKVAIQVVEKGKEKEGSFRAPTYTLTLEKTTAYAGEKIPYTLRFTWQNPAIEPLQLEPPKVPKISFSTRQNGQAKTQKIGSEQVQVIEYAGFLVAQEQGTFTLPRLRADYSVPAALNDWATIFRFSQRERQTLFSQPVILVVKSLPPTSSKEILCVGQVSAFSAQLSADSVARGEAVTLTLTVRADADLTSMKAPSLTLPDSIKYYESKKTVDPQGAFVSFDYILQGHVEGEFTIPAQRITYFDPMSHSYKSKETDPLSLRVLPGKELPAMPEAAEEIRKDDEEKNEASEPVPFSIPFSLFIILILFPPGSRLVLKLFRWLNPTLMIWRKRWRAQRALRSAEGKIRQQMKRGEVDGIYALLKNSLALHSGREDLRDDQLEDFVVQLQCDEETKNELKSLLREALDYSSYARPTKTRQEIDSFFSRVSALLTKLRSVTLLLILIAFSAAPLHAGVLESSLEAIPFILWQGAVLVGWWLLWFAPRKLATTTRNLLVFLWLCCVVGWALQAPSEYRRTYRPCKHLKLAASLYVGPDISYPVRAHLDEHEEIALVKRSGSWYYVSSLKGSGWIQADKLSL